MSGLKDKVVIVTGGTSGIGRATALSFAEHGAKVIVTGCRAGPLAEATADHPLIAGFIADVSAPGDAARTVNETLNTWGRVDIVVNNAGVGTALPMAEVTAELVTRIFAVNVLGPSLLAAAALPYLASSKGAIVNVSSTLGHKAAAGRSHDAASKAALDHLTRCWALELAPRGVRVNAVAAGPMESGAPTRMMVPSPEPVEAVDEQAREQIPLKRRGYPAEVARWIVSLADPASEWVTGQVVTIDGGLGIS